MTAMSETVWPGPLPIKVMMQVQWDQAFEFLFLLTSDDRSPAVGLWLSKTKASDDRDVRRSNIDKLIDVLFEGKQVELALSWSFLAADPAKPETIQAFVPQVAALVNKAICEDDVYSAVEAERLRETLNVWTNAAGGEHVDARISLFAIAASRARPVASEGFKQLRAKFFRQLEESDADDSPGLVVMPKDKATKLVAELAHFKPLIGKKMPFAMVSDVYQVQAQLRMEYPHAWSAIDLLTRDLRDGKPVRMKPVILLGDSGSGKSRLVRRLADLLAVGAGNGATGMFLYRFDASSVGDSLSWAGTARGWGNSTPSVPARAVQQSMQANPMCLIEEIEKSGRGYQGSIYSAMTPFLERETSRRYRDISLDSELDLSWISYLATANDATKIPAHIMDRFRVIKVPLPGLEHLRPLARGIMADLAVEEELDHRWMAPLDADEELVIANAWAKAGFSIRKLQKIIGATLEARDAVAPRQ
jgi:ATP-dependent Lon protease